MTKNTIYKKRNDKYESRSNKKLTILKKKRTYRSILYSRIHSNYTLSSYLHEYFS